MFGLKTAAILVGAAALAGLGACHGRPAISAIGDARRGAQLITLEGCGACHTVPGVSGANGLAAPPLTHMAQRAVIAGLAANTPENLIAWLEAPQRLVPGNAMPDMNLSREDARDIAAYLYTLR